jgi:hypothetical protein
MKRTHIEDYKKIQDASDFDYTIIDKQDTKRANAAQRNRRQRHYVNAMLRHMSNDIDMNELHFY